MTISPPTPMRPAALEPTDPSRLFGQPPATSLAAHQARYGPPPARVLDLIGEVGRAGLRGRGGARFPTAQKLMAVAPLKRAVVVANGCEGEPASAKDKTLLRYAPHLVLDGAAMAADAVGADEVHLCIERNQPDLVAVLEGAIAERAAAGIDRVRVRVQQVPNRYVAGEESALVHWLNGGEAKPTLVPPRVLTRGVHRRPTLVDNVETLAQMALIGRFGAEWYRALGTADDPGTFLLTISGAVSRPGVYEVPGGTSLTTALEAAGGALADTQAVLLGGFFGTWIPNAAVPLVNLDAPSLQTFGASLGSGVVVALPNRACGLVESARVARWLADQNAGQCGPCVHGLDAIAEQMAQLTGRGRSRKTIAALDELMGLVAGRGACKHPDGAVRFVASSLEVFREHAALHDRSGPCPAHAPVLPTPETGGWR